VAGTWSWRFSCKVSSGAADWPLTVLSGWGQLFNQALLIILLLIFHGSGNPPYGATSAQWTFRVSFGIMALMTLWLGERIS
jgi:hypothetical protein